MLTYAEQAAQQQQHNRVLFDLDVSKAHALPLALY
jgi:hypothetical protein